MKLSNFIDALIQVKEKLGDTDIFVRADQGIVTQLEVSSYTFEKEGTRVLIIEPMDYQLPVNDPNNTTH